LVLVPDSVPVGIEVPIYERVLTAFVTSTIAIHLEKI